MKTIYGFTRSISFKFMLVGFLSLVLLIPTAWIRTIIKERESRNQEVGKEIFSIWGGNQTVAGPVLSIPYNKRITSGDKTYLQPGIAHFLPEKLDIDAVIYPSERYRGIFRVVVYNAEIKIRGSFAPPEFEQLDLNVNEAELGDASLSVGITDMRGIQQEILFRLNNKLLQVNPGSLYKDIIPVGFHVNSIGIEDLLNREFDFSIDLSLNGSGSLGFYPIGRITNAHMSSTWPDPSFEGTFLPLNPEISDSGFNASWLITLLNRNYPQSWKNGEYGIEDSSFYTGLFLPVNHYQKSERSLKYAIMFIALTFLLFLLMEILNRKKLHPIQYLMVGLTISVFYILLVSLSEHMPFALAYLVSSIAVISLITFYIHGNYQSNSVTLTTFFILLSLYVFLFVLLQMQDYSLLFGSIGLFMVLGTFMFITRRINWYKEEDQED